MKTLVLSTLLTAGLLQAGAGCIISGDDDDDDVVDDGDDTGDDGGAGFLFNPTWECPADAERITFTATPSGSSTSLDPDTFDCGAGTPDILYDAGAYTIDIQPEAEDITFLGQTDEIEGADGDRVAADYTFPVGVGFFELTWTIDDEDPAAGGCDVIGSNGVTVLATLIGPDTATDDIFNCEDGHAITDELELGDYEVQLNVIDDVDGLIAASEVFPTSLLYDDQLEDLGNLSISTAP